MITAPPGDGVNARVLQDRGRARQAVGTPFVYPPTLNQGPQVSVLGPQASPLTSLCDCLLPQR